MNTHYVATVRAAVLLFLFFQELIHALVFQHFEVFNHAHAVVFPVARVQMSKLLAGHYFALIAELNLAAGQLLATPFDITVLLSGTATRAVSHPAPYPRHTMSKRQVSFANSAVHTARSNEFRTGRLCHHTEHYSMASQFNIFAPCLNRKTNWFAFLLGNTFTLTLEFKKAAK